MTKFCACLVAIFPAPRSTGKPACPRKGLAQGYFEAQPHNHQANERRPYQRHPAIALSAHFHLQHLRLNRDNCSGRVSSKSKQPESEKVRQKKGNGRRTVR